MSSKKYLSAQDILSANDLTTEEVHVPEWGGTVLVSEMSAHARDEFEQWMGRQYRSTQDQEDPYYHVRAPLCAMCIVDSNGNRLFSIEQVERLGRKNGNALDRVYEAANRLNKVFGQEREQEVKNSEAAPSEEGGGE